MEQVAFGQRLIPFLQTTSANDVDAGVGPSRKIGAGLHRVNLTGYTLPGKMLSQRAFDDQQLTYGITSVGINTLTAHSSRAQRTHHRIGANVNHFWLIN